MSLNAIFDADTDRCYCELQWIVTIPQPLDDEDDKGGAIRLELSGVQPCDKLLTFALEHDRHGALEVDLLIDGLTIELKQIKISPLLADCPDVMSCMQSTLIDLDQVQQKYNIHLEVGTMCQTSVWITIREKVCIVYCYFQANSTFGKLFC